MAWLSVGRVYRHNGGGRGRSWASRPERPLKSSRRSGLSLSGCHSRHAKRSGLLVRVGSGITGIWSSGHPLSRYTLETASAASGFQVDVDLRHPGPSQSSSIGRLGARDGNGNGWSPVESRHPGRTLEPVIDHPPWLVGRWLRWKPHLAYPGEGGHRSDGLLICLAVMAEQNDLGPWPNLVVGILPEWWGVK